MATIQIAYEVPAEVVAKIEKHLNEVALRDANWNGAEFSIERDEFTCILENESPEAVVLLNEINGIILGEQ